MIIDFHTHTFPDRIAKRTIDKLSLTAHINHYTDGTVNGLLNNMSKSNVDLSVILPVVTKPSQFETINKTAVAINEMYDKKLISFGGIHPDSSNFKDQIKEIKRMGLKGIKLHPDYQLVNFDDIRYMRIVYEAECLGLITVVHAGVDVGYPNPVHCTPAMSSKIIDEIKPQKLVLAHMGGYAMWDDVLRFICGKNVYLDTAYTFDMMGESKFLELVRAHGIDKILFATDSPWKDLNESVKWINNLSLTDEDKMQILGGNAEKLLNI